MKSGKRVFRKTDKKILAAFIIVELFALAIGVKENLLEDGFDRTLARPEAGGEIKSYDLDLVLDGKRENISVAVSPISRDKKEIQDLIESAKSEIDESFWGSNNSPDRVCNDLYPHARYSNGTVSAKWEFDNYSVMDGGGRINLGAVNEETVINATCTLSCEDVSEIYQFAFIVPVPDTSTKAGFDYLLNKKLKEADLKNKEDTMVKLPTNIGDTKLLWAKPKSYTGLYLAIFGVTVVFALTFAQKEDEKKQKDILQKEKERDYPDIISMLSLYVGAGISVKGAFVRIAENYTNGIKIRGAPKRAGFEGVCMLCRDMGDGKGELDAYRDFGKRMAQKDYRKLSIILTQNLRKGSSHLVDQLEKEEHRAFELRKMRAKILGEEASTKLLIPMLALLMVVLVVLIFPALQTMSL